MDGDAVPQGPPVPLQPASEQGIGELLTDPVALFHGRTVAIGGASPADRPGLVAALGIWVGLQAAAFELLHQGEGYGDGGGNVGHRSRPSPGGSLMGCPEPAQGAAFLHGLGLMGHQLLQNRQQPGPVMRELGIEVLDVVVGRDGFVHRNTPRRPGAKATWLFAAALCMPEGKKRALTVIQRSRQAFTWRGAWIQLGSSQAPTNAVEKMIWPVSRPWEAATPSSRGKGFMKQETFVFRFYCHVTLETDSMHSGQLMHFAQNNYK